MRGYENTTERDNDTDRFDSVVTTQTSATVRSDTLFFLTCDSESVNKQVRVNVRLQSVEKLSLIHI